MGTTLQHFHTIPTACAILPCVGLCAWEGGGRHWLGYIQGGVLKSYFLTAVFSFTQTVAMYKRLSCTVDDRNTCLLRWPI